MLLNCCIGEDSWVSLGQQGDQTSQSYGKSTLHIHWKTDAEVEAPILWPPEANNPHTGKAPDAGKDRRQKRWQRMSLMASLMQWTGTGANSGRWWGTGKPDMLHSMGHEEWDTTWRLNKNNKHLYVAFPTLYENNVYYYWDNVKGYIFILSLWNLIRVYTACVTSPVWIFVTPLTVGQQTPLSM